MENQENEIIQPVPEQPAAQAQHVPQPDPQPAPQSEPQWQQSFYHGAGVGQRETPYGQSPYATYHGYRQPWQTPPQWQGYQQNWQPPVQPQNQPEKKKKGGKVWRTILCTVLILALVVSCCGATAYLCNQYWQEQYDLIKQNMADKLTALQQQIDDNQIKVESGGSLGDGQTLTAAQIYQQNVNSVVAITCAVRKTNSAGQIVESHTSGTGFVITENGYIVTNHHVIDDATKITVTMSNGMEYAAVLVGSNDTNDVAVIKVGATALDPVTIGSSSAMQVGDQVVAIGNALGELSSSLTVGYISGMDRDVSTDGTVINMIQTDAAINSGNSGGPLFNAKGEVIGITTAKYSGTTTSGASIEGISFAIPMDDVIDMIEDLRDFGYIKSAFLGVMVWEVDATVAATYNLPQGVYVEEVTPGYCAEKAGVRAKDIIVELGGYTIKTMNDLSRALRSYEAGETVTIVVWRSGQEIILNITLDEKPAT